MTPVAWDLNVAWCCNCEEVVQAFPTEVEREKLECLGHWYEATQQDNIMLITDHKVLPSKSTYTKRSWP
eukprot:COSAG01_NODE_10224_length_2216_cov_265.183278_2_plen_69_part_00